MLRAPSATTRVPTVATKLRVPPAPRHLVLRKRLLEILDGGVEERLVLLCAPAGSGKTVLLSSWIQTRRLPGAPCWLSLDADDNDASRLIADLLSALRESGVSTPGDLLAGLTAPVGARTERFMPLLVNALAELRSPVVVVLDEIHELTSPQATATIDFLVRHAPEQLRLVLAGRADPTLPIERLRVGGGLTELRIGDLAFDLQETAELCRQLELTLSDADIELLWTRTEGWAAALRLAALSLHGHPAPARFLADLSGTDRAVADYLVSEVLTHLPEDRREFMLRTCVPDAVNPELADALTGLDSGASALAALEHSGAPVHPADLDDHGRWYRFHPLFRELLRAHLHHAHPEEEPFLHRRAARWYAEQGQTMPAVRHALAGKDWEQAGDLIVENWLELFLQGRSAAMRVPMAQVPSEIVTADPRLAAAFAGSRLQDGDLESAAQHLAIARSARSALAPHERELLDLSIAAVALHEARLLTRSADAERLSEELGEVARTRARPDWASLRSFALANLGAARLWSGAGDSAAAPLQEALALATEHHHEQIALDCLAQLAIVHLLRGELTRAKELSTQAVAVAERHGWGEGPAAASAYLGRAAVAYRGGEFEHAEGLLSHAAVAAETAEAPVRLATALLQALTLAAAGPGSAARGALKLSALRSAAAQGASVPVLPDFLLLALADIEPRVLLAAGEIEQARATLAQARATLPPSTELLVRRAAIELHAGETERAAEALASALDGEAPLEFAPSAGHPGEDLPRATAATAPAAGCEPRAATLLEAWLLRALLEHARGERRAAAQALDRALALAEREPLRDAFLVNGPGVGELLELQAQEGTAHPALLEVLLEGASRRRPSGTVLAEPLTEREQRILRYLPTMLSNAEIGAEVFVSLNTVKTHLRSIYRKLGANGRADAVEKARALGLLPSGIKRPRVVQRT
ncbi:MAG TPA: LuxR C-terminal-related transcriptional regulator [Solirubrobacteraceae bacterium]|jgi:LuxR family maltose regulon positive regulatory protein|nr:LuxR C-terminal-related transcriptional regulator [Solirubrobacteraceae bacterium]